MNKFVHNSKKLVLSLVLGFGVATTASATVLDFTPLGAGDTGSATASIVGADIEAFGGATLHVGAGPFGPNSICALSGSCANDMEIAFTSAVENVAFGHGFWGVGDLVDISVFGLGDVLLGNYIINSAASVDLSGFGTITRLFFDDSSTAAGVAYGDISFDYANAVPEPQMIALVAMGLVGIGFARRKTRS